MSAFDKIQKIVNFYEVNRRVGHTTTTIKGVNGVENVPIIVVLNKQMGDDLERKIKDYQMEENDCLNEDSAKIISIHELEKLRGMRCPLVLEHTVIQQLFKDAIEEYQLLEKENQSLKEINNKLL